MPTDEDFKTRARVIVERMAEVSRIVYAIPSAIGRAAIEAAIGDAGLTVVEVDPETEVARFTDDGGDDTLVLLSRDDLGVFIFEARGSHAVERVRTILSKVPFVPQSKLLREAIDVASPDAPKALLVLAHCVVTWDDDWGDLFLLHLASPDPIARHNAVASTFLAAMVSGANARAVELLREASAREKFPKLKETIDDAIERLGS